MTQATMLICDCGNRAYWQEVGKPPMCHDCLAADLLKGQAEYDAIWHPNGRPEDPPSRPGSSLRWDGDELVPYYGGLPARWAYDDA